MMAMDKMQGQVQVSQHRSHRDHCRLKAGILVLHPALDLLYALFDMAVRQWFLHSAIALQRPFKSR
jgi:hypothetical protein